MYGYRDIYTNRKYVNQKYFDEKYITICRYIGTTTIIYMMN